MKEAGKSKMRVQNFRLPFKKDEKIIIFREVSPDNYREVLSNAPAGSRFAILFSLYPFSNQRKMIVFDRVDEFPRAFRKLRQIIRDSIPIPALCLVESCTILAFCQTGAEGRENGSKQ